MSIRLGASLCAKKLIITGEKWTVFIIQQTYLGFYFFQWKSSPCLRPFPWRRCRGRDPGLVRWRSRTGIDQSETSLLAGLTSLLKRKEPLVRRRTLQLQSDVRYDVITRISQLKSKSCMISHQLPVTRRCILRCGRKTSSNERQRYFWGAFPCPFGSGWAPKVRWVNSFLT